MGAKEDAERRIADRKAAALAVTPDTTGTVGRALPGTRASKAPKDMAVHGQKLKALSQELAGRISHVGSSGTPDAVDAHRKAASHVDAADTHLMAHFSALSRGDHEAAASHFGKAAVQLSSAANALPKGSTMLSDNWQPTKNEPEWNEKGDTSAVSVDKIHQKINTLTNGLWSDLKSPGQPELPAHLNTPPRVTESTTSTPTKGAKSNVVKQMDKAANPAKKIDPQTGEVVEPESGLIGEMSKPTKSHVYTPDATIPTREPRQNAPATTAALESRPYTAATPSSMGVTEGDVGRREALNKLMGTKEHWMEAEKKAAAAEDRTPDSSKFYSSTAYTHPQAYRAEHGLDMRTGTAEDQLGRKKGSGEGAEKTQGSRYKNTALKGLSFGDIEKPDTEERGRSDAFARAHATSVSNGGTEEETMRLPKLDEAQQYALKGEIERGTGIEQAKVSRANKRGEARTAAVRQATARPQRGTNPAAPRSQNEPLPMPPQPSERGAAAIAAAGRRAAATAAAPLPTPNRGPEARAIARTRASASDKVRRTRASEFSLGML